MSFHAHAKASGVESGTPGTPGTRVQSATAIAVAVGSSATERRTGSVVGVGSDSANGASSSWNVGSGVAKKGATPAFKTPGASVAGSTPLAAASAPFTPAAAKAAAPFVPSGAARKPDAKGLAAAAAKLSVAAPAFVPKAKAAGAETKA